MAEKPAVSAGEGGTGEWGMNNKDVDRARAAEIGTSLLGSGRCKEHGHALDENGICPNPTCKLHGLQTLDQKPGR